MVAQLAVLSVSGSLGFGEGLHCTADVTESTEVLEPGGAFSRDARRDARDAGGRDSRVTAGDEMTNCWCLFF